MEKINKRLYLLDMDGTLYLGDRLFDGTLEFLDFIKASGASYMFLTNNSSRGVESYVEKLTRLGIEASSEDFFTSSDATVSYLKTKNYGKIYAMGTESFKKQLRDSGLPVTDMPEAGIDCVLISNDQELTFKKLDDVCRLLTGREIAYIATNPDSVCPTEYGYVPDCGSFADIIYNAVKKRPLFIGKPQPQMIFAACEKRGVEKSEAIIFGDRLYTDIKSGVNAGITTVFVLSGEGTGFAAPFNTYPDGSMWVNLIASDYLSKLHRYYFPENLCFVESYTQSVETNIDDPGTPAYSYVCRNVYWQSADEDTPIEPGKTRTDEMGYVVSSAYAGRIHGTFTDNVAYSSEIDMGFVDEENGNYALKDDSIIFRDIMGFENIPFDQIGRITK